MCFVSTSLLYITAIVIWFPRLKGKCSALMLKKTCCEVHRLAERIFVLSSIVAYSSKSMQCYNF